MTSVVCAKLVDLPKPAKRKSEEAVEQLLSNTRPNRVSQFRAKTGRFDLDQLLRKLRRTKSTKRISQLLPRFRYQS